MTGIRNIHTLLDAETTTSLYGTPAQLDWKNDSGEPKTLCGSLTAGDLVVVEGSPNKGSDYFVIGTYSSVSFVDTIYGPWTHIRAVKVSSSGPSSVFLLG